MPSMVLRKMGPNLENRATQKLTLLRGLRRTKLKRYNIYVEQNTELHQISVSSKCEKFHNI